MDKAVVAWEDVTVNHTQGDEWDGRGVEGQWDSDPPLLSGGVDVELALQDVVDHRLA